MRVKNKKKYTVRTEVVWRREKLRMGKRVYCMSDVVK